MNQAYLPSLEEETAKLEQARVELILQVFGLNEWRGQVLDAQAQASGRQQLGLAGFDRVFPGFPVCLVAKPLYRLVEHSTCSQTALFRNYRRYVAYEQFLEIWEDTAEHASGRPIGLLYRWQGVKHGLILHNGNFPSRDFRQVFPWGKKRLTVEHFRRFVRTLAAGKWDLDSLRSRPDQATVREPCQPPTPWALARLAKDGTELRLLGFLIEVLYHLPTDQAQQYVVRRDGERWVAVPQERLSELLQVSVRTIQRAVASLEREALIETHRNGYLENEMRLCPKVFA